MREASATNAMLKMTAEIGGVLKDAFSEQSMFMNHQTLMQRCLDMGMNINPYMHAAGMVGMVVQLTPRTSRCTKAVKP